MAPSAGGWREGPWLCLLVLPALVLLFGSSLRVEGPGVLETVWRPSAFEGQPEAAPPAGVEIAPWLLAPAGVWGAWLLMLAAGERARGLRGAWRRRDLPLAALGVGLVVPFATLPIVASVVLGAALRRRLDGGRSQAERLWGAGPFLALVAVATAHFALVTHGTGNLAAGELLGSAYDSLADHLVRGSSEVDRRAIRWEVFDVGGRPTMYFGPLPALLRIPAHWIAPSGYGRWSRLSCWIAALLAVAAAQLVLRAPLRKNPRLSPRARRAVLAVSTLGFGLGTPVAFAMSAAAIYHEAPLWGLAASLFGVHFALALSRSRERPGPALALLACAAGAALLARVTFGAPLYLLLGLFGLLQLRDARRGGHPLPAETLRLALWTSPALAMLAFQLWLNHDRFGSITTFIDFRYLAYLAEDTRSWSILQNAGTFHPGRIPTGLANYFGLRPEALLTRFPFVAMIRPLYLAPDLYPSIFRETVASLLVVSGWLVAGALVGVAGLCRAGAGGVTRGVVGILFTQPLVVLAYYVVSQRYALDFLPFLWAGYACFLGGLGRRVGATAAVIVLAGAVAASALATGFATLSWIPRSRRFTSYVYKDRVTSAVSEARARLSLPGGTLEP